MKDLKTESKKLLSGLAMTTKTSDQKKGDSLNLSPSTVPCVKSIGKTNNNCSIEAVSMNFEQGTIHE